MIALSTTPTARAAIDDAVDTVLIRLARRLRDHGDGARALASAIARSAQGGKRFRPLLVVAAFARPRRGALAWARTAPRSSTTAAFTVSPLIAGLCPTWSPLIAGLCPARSPLIAGLRASRRAGR